MAVWHIRCRMPETNSTKLLFSVIKNYIAQQTHLPCMWATAFTAFTTIQLEPTTQNEHKNAGEKLIKWCTKHYPNGVRWAMQKWMYITGWRRRNTPWNINTISFYNLSRTFVLRAHKQPATDIGGTEFACSAHASHTCTSSEQQNYIYRIGSENVRWCSSCTNFEYLTTYLFRCFRSFFSMSIFVVVRTHTHTQG